MERHIELRRLINELDAETKTVEAEFRSITDSAELEKRSKRLDEIVEERAKYQKEYDEVMAAREKAHNEIAKMPGEKAMKEERKKTVELTPREVRNAFAREFRNSVIKLLDDRERRDLGITAITTTDTVYVAPSEETIGINNGGLFIEKTMSNELLREIALASPFLQDVNITSYPGVTEYRVQLYSSGAEIVNENKDGKGCTPDESNEYGTIAITIGNYAKSIEVTFELLALAISELADILISEMAEAMAELIATQALYGNGSKNQMTGATVGAIPANYTISASSTIVDAIVAAKAKLPIRRRMGAKIYAAPDIFDSISALKTTDGSYIFPVLNGVGLNTIATMPVVQEPYLKEGEFLIGNPSRWYKANATKPVTYGTDVSNKCRIVTYTAHAMIGGAPVPNSFVYGKKTT